MISVRNAYRFMVSLFVVVAWPCIALAQEVLPPAPGAVVESGPVRDTMKKTVEPLSLDASGKKKIPSLFFTYWQHQSILDALNARSKLVQLPQELLDNKSIDDGMGAEEGSEPVKPADREIRLGGILYNSEKEWTVWMNEMRITPTAVPPEIIYLSVTKEHIDVKWYDRYTNKIFPIRLRPHQRFNLDTRVFLPG